VKAATIGRRVAAIRSTYNLAGVPDWTEGEPVRSAIRDIRRTIGAATRRKAPATAEILGAMLSHCLPTLTSKRDRTFLALGFSGTFCRSERRLDMTDLVEKCNGRAGARLAGRAGARRSPFRTTATSSPWRSPRNGL
jgi:hypothetical protein